MIIYFIWILLPTANLCCYLEYSGATWVILEIRLKKSVPSSDAKLHQTARYFKKKLWSLMSHVDLSSLQQIVYRLLRSETWKLSLSFIVIFRKYLNLTTCRQSELTVIRAIRYALLVVDFMVAQTTIISSFSKALNSQIGASFVLLMWFLQVVQRLLYIGDPCITHHTFDACKTFCTTCSHGAAIR